ncbi:MAG: type IV pilus twitching motility protein PilT [Candidatus Marinimicrobia bacterium]|nr:type IV pilus twitching motility protein PilT [Candidatus Neomarinimicrobiota bacterium]MBL7046657.1 type IV pilus twitching motility protein PilT [Candidatus Neomarinimicrobiota bacterium]
MKVHELLNFMREVNASDLHLSPFSAPIVRINGEIQRSKLTPLQPEDVHILVYDIMKEEQRKLYEEELEIDFSCDFHGIGRFRVNVFKSLHGDTAVLRAISERSFTFEELGLPVVLKELVIREKGLILVTGPTGSGKSTTLNTLIDYINKHQRKHIITIEDPIEFVHVSKKSLINHREVGTSTYSFVKALRSALREDPDVIVVGEMRDLETTALAVTAAETGHLVFGTLHTINATKTLDRIIDQFPADRQSQIRIMLSESILGIIAQVLLKKKGGGRIAAFEIMVGTAAVANLIRENKTFQLPSILQTSGKIGMITMEQSLIKLYKGGLIEEKDALEAVTDPDELRKSLE